MSPVRAVRCPNCKAVLKLKSGSPEGKRIRCPQCGTAFKVGEHSTFESSGTEESLLPRQKHGPTSRSQRPTDQSSLSGVGMVGSILVGVILLGVLIGAGFYTYSPQPATPVPPTAKASSSSSKPAGQKTAITAPEQPELADSIPSVPMPSDPIPTESVSEKPAVPETIRFLVAEGAEGLKPVIMPDGPFTDATVGTGIDLKRALKLDSKYLYLNVSDEILFDMPEHHTQPYLLSLEYFDAKSGKLDLQYDAYQYEADAPHDGRWKTTEKTTLDGTEEWKEASFVLNNIKFANRQHGKADFRLRTEPGEAIAVRDISLTPQDESPPELASRTNSSANEPKNNSSENTPLDPVTPSDLAIGFRATWFADTKFKQQVRQEVLAKPIDFFWEKSPGKGIDADGWATRYEGVLPIPKADDYEFHLKSDDGSRLWIDDELVVDHWGLHGPETKTGKVRLSPGLHTLRIDHFDDQFGAHLSLRMTNPTTGKPETFPLALMRHDARKAEGWKVVRDTEEPKSPPPSRPEEPSVLEGEGAELKLVKKVELQTPQSHGGFHSYDFSPDGTLLAGGTGLGGFTSGGKTTEFGGEVLLWNPLTGRLTETLGSHGASVSAVIFSDDGKTLVSVSSDNGLIKVWDVTSRTERRTIQLEGDDSKTSRPAPLVAISPNGNYLAAAPSVPRSEGSNIFEHRNLGLWNLTTGKEFGSLEEGILEAITFSPDGLTLLAEIKHLEEAGTDSRGRKRYRQTLEIVEIDVESGSITARNPPAQKRTLNAIAFVGENHILAGLSSNGLTLRDRETKEVLGEYEWHDDRPFFDVYGFSSDGRFLLRGKNEYLEVSDLKEGKVIGLLTAEFPKTLWNIAVANDLRTIVCNFDHTPTVFEISGVERR